MPPLSPTSKPPSQPELFGFSVAPVSLELILFLRSIGSPVYAALKKAEAAFIEMSRQENAEERKQIFERMLRELREIAMREDAAETFVFVFCLVTPLQTCKAILANGGKTFLGAARQEFARLNRHEFKTLTVAASKHFVQAWMEGWMKAQAERRGMQYE